MRNVDSGWSCYELDDDRMKKTRPTIRRRRSWHFDDEEETMDEDDNCWWRWWLRGWQQWQTMLMFVVFVDGVVLVVKNCWCCWPWCCWLFQRCCDVDHVDDDDVGDVDDGDVYHDDTRIFDNGRLQNRWRCQRLTTTPTRRLAGQPYCIGESDDKSATRTPLSNKSMKITSRLRQT